MMTISLDDKSEKQCLHELVCYGCTHHAGLPSLYGLPTPCPFDVQCLKPFQHLFEFIFYLIFCAINRFFFFFGQCNDKEASEMYLSLPKGNKRLLDEVGQNQESQSDGVEVQGTNVHKPAKKRDR